MPVDGEEKTTENSTPTHDAQINDERYTTLFEQVNAAAFLTTLDGEILEANHKSCELFGYTWEELLRLSLRDILTKETEWDQFMEEISSRGGLYIETENVRKNGDHVPVEMSTSLFRMKGKPVMFVLIWDITERKQAEKNLRESEKKYRGLFEYATDGILVLDARGEILDVNTRMCELFDLKKNELIGQNLLNMDFLTSASLPVVVNQFEELLSEKNAKNYTTEIKNRNGKTMHVEISSFFLVKQNNEVDSFVLIFRDSTDRIEAERKRLKEHELLQTLMNNVPDSIYFKDRENRFVLVNKTKASHWGVTPEAMIGKTDFDFLPHDQAQQAFDDDNRIMQTGEPVIDKVEKITESNGVEKWFSVTKIPRFDKEGTIIGTIGISRNITEWKQHELIQKEPNE